MFLWNVSDNSTYEDLLYTTTVNNKSNFSDLQLQLTAYQTALKCDLHSLIKHINDDSDQMSELIMPDYAHFNLSFAQISTSHQLFFI